MTMARPVVQEAVFMGRFMPLKLKLGRHKRHCIDMVTLMAALVKYVDSDSTKDPESEDDKPGKGKKNGNTKG